MKRASLLAVLMVASPLGAVANTLPGADVDGPQRTGLTQAPRQVDEPQGNAARRVARDESIRWSEPFYRYGQREPAMEELTRNGNSPGSGDATPIQPRH